jgi:hypothetical protein
MIILHVFWLATDGSFLEIRPTVAPTRMAAALSMVPVRSRAFPAEIQVTQKNHHCNWRLRRAFILFCGSGRSVAWLARLFRVQEVVSSNLTAPTIFRRRGWAQTAHGWQQGARPVRSFVKNARSGRNTLRELSWWRSSTPSPTCGPFATRPRPPAGPSRSARSRAGRRCRSGDVIPWNMGIHTSGMLKQTAGKRRMGYLAGAHDDSEQDPTPPLRGSAKPEGT